MLPYSTLRRSESMPSNASRTAVRRSWTQRSCRRGRPRPSRSCGPCRGRRRWRCRLVRRPASASADAGIGEIDERLTAFLLQDADGVLDGVADLVDDLGDAEQLGRFPAGEHRGETPDRGQGQAARAAAPRSSGGSISRESAWPPPARPPAAGGVREQRMRSTSTNGVSLLLTQEQLEGRPGACRPP